MTVPSDCLINRVQKVDCDAAVVDVAVLHEDAVFVLGEQALLFVPAQGAPERVPVHEGAILCSAWSGNRLITGGDDGRVQVTDAARAVQPVHADAKGRWIDCVALGETGAAWSAGRQAFFKAEGRGEVACLDLPSSIGGLSVSPDGASLAIAHYNGVTIWPAAGAAARLLDWKGSHLGATFSPDGGFVVTRMREPALHGWRLQDGEHVPMLGYASPVRSFSWTLGGKWLATSGSHYLMLWPFHKFEHPMGAVPLRLCGYRAVSTAVAAHPAFDLVAVGYEDGMALLIRIEDEAEILVKNPGGAPVAALAWNARGTRLALACEDGSGRVIDLDFAG